MTKTELVALAVCTDCIAFLANNSVEDGQGNDVTEAHAAKIQAHWGEPVELVPGSEFGELPEGAFSWQACEGCGSDLGGDRHAATWITR